MMGQPVRRMYLMRVPLAQHCAYAESRVPICEYAMDGGPPPNPARLGSPSTKERSDCPANVLNAGAFGPAFRIRRYEGPNLRIRDGQRSATSSRSAQAPKHQGGTGFPENVLNAGAFGPALRIR